MKLNVAALAVLAVTLAAAPVLSLATDTSSPPMKPKHHHHHKSGGTSTSTGTTAPK